MKKTIISLFMAFSVIFSYAQTCSWFPADCPERMEELTDSMHCIRSFIVPQEITMQNRIRQFLTDQLDRITNLKKWDYYVVEETADARFFTPAHGEAYPVPYPLRAPHVYSVSYILIVNDDSLKAWKYWYYNVLTEKTKNWTDDYTQKMNDPSYLDAQKAYEDSAEYWNAQYANYMSANYPAYTKAIQNRDEAGIRKYDNGIKEYQAQMNDWSAKSKAIRDQAISGSNNAMNALQKYRLTTAQAFRNSSLIRIKFVFNENLAQDVESPRLKLAKNIPVQNAVVAQLYHNSNRDGNGKFDEQDFSPTSDLAFLLFGNWNLKRFQDKVGHADYETNKLNTDKVTVKKVACDRLQTILVTIGGDPGYIQEFIKLFDLGKLGDMTVKQ